MGHKLQVASEVVALSLLGLEVIHYVCAYQEVLYSTSKEVTCTIRAYLYASELRAVCVQFFGGIGILQNFNMYSLPKIVPIYYSSSSSR